ncbi:HAD family hydrolase [Polyangium aurulentum]|uniref:HAD family hydrolase n=1 Tax=Polyangium aurulentum TaxID=2567896 RepID=UPI00146B545C|nr:haloacid dehalogenase-like hydrolase [Polyangium aurulentum]UQA60964.1 haloacid dehalogenase-like hydrolase [Polyangium aurulentum]
MTAEDVIARLADVRAEASAETAVLAFDADGTLWSGDVGEDLFHALLHEGALRDDARGALAEEARLFGVPDDGDATALARALYDGYTAGKYPEDRVFAMMAWCSAGFTIDEARAYAEGIVARGKLGDRLHRFLEPVLRWAEAERVGVWVVSASPRWIVEIGVAKLGIPAAQVVAMEPRIEGDRIAPSLAGPPVYNEHKPVALFAARPGAEVLGAFGDSSYDVPLLRASRVPVAVRPKPGLLARAAEVPQLVAIGA